MEKLKNQLGVTVIGLVITITLLLIITAVSFKIGANEVDDSVNSNQKIELETVQTAVLNRATLHKTANAPLIGENISIDDVKNYAQSIGVNQLVTIPTGYPNSEYYILTPNKLKEIGIDNVVDSYIVNYASGEVMNYTTKTNDTNDPLYIIGTSNFESDM